MIIPPSREGLISVELFSSQRNLTNADLKLTDNLSKSEATVLVLTQFALDYASIRPTLLSIVLANNQMIAGNSPCG